MKNAPALARGTIERVLIVGLESEADAPIEQNVRMMPGDVLVIPQSIF